jgi:hypothetical protein
MRLAPFAVEAPKYGSAGSLIIGFAIKTTSRVTAVIFIKIPSSAISWQLRPSIVIAPPFPDSNSTFGPQRLKPQSWRRLQLARVELVPFPVVHSALPGSA